MLFLHKIEKNSHIWRDHVLILWFLIHEKQKVPTFVSAFLCSESPAELTASKPCFVSRRIQRTFQPLVIITATIPPPTRPLHDGRMSCEQ